MLQEKEIRRVGSNERVKIDVRVIAATNRDLEAAFRNGTFRKDLFFRLNVVSVHLPALRERKGDIPALVELFLDRFALDKQLHVSNAALKCLLQYDWPGNVRELENCIERAVTLRNHDVLDVLDLPPAIRGVVVTSSTAEAVRSDEVFDSGSSPARVYSGSCERAQAGVRRRRGPRRDSFPLA